MVNTAKLNASQFFFNIYLNKTMKRNCYFRKKLFFQQACMLALLFMLYAGQASANYSNTDNKNLNIIEQEKESAQK